MQETKAFWKSRGFLGPLVAVLAMMLDGAGLGTIDQGQLVDWLLNGFEIGGAVLGIVGRARATTRLGLRDAPAPAAAGSRPERAAGFQAAWPANLLAGLLTILLIGGCATSGLAPQTTAQRFYAAEADYEALLKFAVAYKRDCEAKPADLRFGCQNDVAEFRRIDSKILWPAIQTGRAAVAGGQDARLAAATQALDTGLRELRNYLIRRGLQPNVEAGPSPPGAPLTLAWQGIEWRFAA